MEIIKHEGKYYTVRVNYEEMVDKSISNKCIIDKLGDFEIMSWSNNIYDLDMTYVIRLTGRGILFRKFDSDINRKKEILFRRF